MASRLADFSSKAKSILLGAYIEGAAPPQKKCVRTYRIQQYFVLLIVWKSNKSDSRHLPETINDYSD